MLASADPATKPLLADARPTLNGDTLVLSYPPTKSFLRQRAEAMALELTGSQIAPNWRLSGWSRPASA